MNTQNSNGKNVMRVTWAVLAAASVTMLAGVTQAATAGDNLPKQAVTYRDLNLNSNEGVQVLYKRIRSAADDVCGKVDSHDLQGMSVKRACLGRAISQAVAAVNNPKLTQLAQVSSKQQPLAFAQVR